MSILGQVLQGISDGLVEGISDSDVSVLQRILDPDAISSRKEAAQLFTEGLGYDPDGYWNRREITEILTAGSDEVDDGHMAEVSDAVIDAALERFENARSALLEIAAWDKDFSVFSGGSAISEYLDGDDDGGDDDDDSDSSSLADEAMRESDEEDGDAEPPEVIDDEDWGGADDQE